MRHLIYKYWNVILLLSNVHLILQILDNDLKILKMESLNRLQVMYESINLSPPNIKIIYRLGYLKNVKLFFFFFIATDMTTRYGGENAIEFVLCLKK